MLKAPRSAEKRRDSPRSAETRGEAPKPAEQAIMCTMTVIGSLETGDCHVNFHMVIYDSLTTNTNVGSFVVATRK